jgi:hypothetical protein
MLWSAHGNPTRHLEPQERLRELYKAPEGSPDHPVRINQVTRNYAPAWGVSTRLLSYLLDELRGEYEKFPIHPHSGSPTVRMYVRSPSGGGLGRRRERQPVLRTSHPATLTPASEGSERANVLALHMGIFQYNNVLVPTVRRVARMRRHLTSIRIMYQHRELYDVYEESAEGEPSHVQFRRLVASQVSPCTGSLQNLIIIIPIHQTASP